MKTLRNCIFLLGSFYLVQGSAVAQFPAGYGWVFPRESPSASLSQTVGVTEITVRYHRPAVNGRKVWGCFPDKGTRPGFPGSECLVPYEHVWRAGANEATTIQISTPVTIGGQALGPGIYGLFMIPGPEEWTVILSKRGKQWGAFTYDPAEDALRISATPRAAPHQERLEYSFPEASNASAVLQLRWEKLSVAFEILVDSAAQSVALAKTKFDWSSGWFAADYLYKSKKNLEDALKWINASIAMEENAGNTLLKARILGELGRIDEAVETAKRVIAIRRASNAQASIADVEELIVKWQGTK